MSRHPYLPPLTALIAVSLLASTALAAPTLPGINIRWDNCFSDGGVMNKSFACDTNAGTEVAVMSLQLDTGMPSVSGVELRISLKAAAPALPAWWDLWNTGGCRPSSLSFDAFPAATATCRDWGQGHGGGGAVAAYRVDEIGSGSAVILMASAVPQTNLVRLDAVTEYTVGALSVNHAKTAGDGACAGCTTPVCILFTSLKVTTPVSVNNDRLFTQGANDVASQVIHWQGGLLTNLTNHCTGTFDCTTQFDCLAASATAARRSTWGAVKSLYR